MSIILGNRIFKRPASNKKDKGEQFSYLLFILHLRKKCLNEVANQNQELDLA